MNGKWRYALFVILALLFATGHANAVQVGIVQALHSFCDLASGCQDGFSPTNLVRGNDGALYGSAHTTVFRFDPATREFSVLHTFDEDDEVRWVTPGSDGSIYGATTEGVFRLSPDGQYTLLHTFASDDSSSTFPATPTVEDSQGNLYGTASYFTDLASRSRAAPNDECGCDECGCGPMIYEITHDGTFKVLHSFSLAQYQNKFLLSLVLAPDGNLYGNDGNLFNIDSDGTLFRITPDGVYTTIHTFNIQLDGARLETPLVVGRDGMLYGNTQIFMSPDGTMWPGTMFRSTLDGQVTTLRVFRFHEDPSGLDFATPLAFANLAKVPDGYFYGVWDGDYILPPNGGAGAIFRFSTAGGVTLLYSFIGPQGGTSIPEVPLVSGIDNALYGVTQTGGKYGRGTLFRYVPPPVQ